MNSLLVVDKYQHKAKLIINKFFSISLIVLISASLIRIDAAVASLDADALAILRDSVYYDSEDNICNESATSMSNSQVNSSNSVYILGDSITNQSNSEISTAFKNKGVPISLINADPGRAITKDTAGTEPSGLQAVDNDKDIIKNSKVVVVALGTNSGIENLSSSIPLLIGKIREHNQSAIIYWVNLFYEDASAGTRNTIISSLSDTEKYFVIDTTKANIQLSTDKVHPTTEGNKTFAETILNGVSITPELPNRAPVLNDSALSLTYPNLSNESTVISNLTNYIKKNKPNSAWLKISPDIGQWLFTESKTRNINPLLIAAIGKQENGFGSSELPHVQKYHNYFGMKGDSPINIPDSAYRGFSTPSEGFTFFLDRVKDNTQANSTGSYKDVRNFYDYVTVHQTGKIVYPGEPFDPEDRTGPSYDGAGNWIKNESKPDGNINDSYDPSMGVFVSWTTTDHPNNSHDGQLYNPLGYYKNSISFINEITGLNLSDLPSKGNVVSNPCQTQSSSSSPGGSGFVDPSSGYSFPLAPQNRRVGGIVINQTATRHHDKTPAFDLFSPIDSASVYAIFDGTVQTLTLPFNDVPGCAAIQLRADDGYFYWYGHLKNPTVRKGDRVKSGQKIAEIADKSFPRTCIGGGTHLHIDRGCIIDNKPQTGGRDACRDPDFIPFLSKLYERLN